MIVKILYLMSFFLCASPIVFAHNLSLQQPAESDSPLEIFADETEWDRETNRVIARGNAVLRKNNDQITASEVIGYLEEKDGKRHLTKAEAFVNVVIKTPTNEVKGEKGTYFTETGYMIMEGPQIVLTSSKNETLTTHTMLEYWDLEKKAIAKYPVTITRDKDIVKGDHLTAYFAEDPETKKSQLSRADLVGNVDIVTPTQTAIGDKGVYTPLQNLAVLEGNVTLTQDGNVLKGEWCQANFETGHNILRNALPGAEKGTKPVYALLMPKSKTLQNTPAKKKAP